MKENLLLQAISANYIYIIVAIMISVGFYMIISQKHLIKKVLGLNLIQGSVVVFYVLLSKIDGGVPPITNLDPAEIDVYSNPLPHVLMLTAIVVGVATTSLAFALIYKVYKNYNTLDEKEISEINKQENF